MELRLQARGQLVITLRDSATGHERVVTVQNKVVNSGLIYLAQHVMNRDGRLISQIAFGRSTQPVNDADTGLASEVSRANLTNWAQTGASLNFNASFGEGNGTGDVTELGLFINDGQLFARTVIPSQYKGDTTTMDVVWTITFIAV